MSVYLFLYNSNTNSFKFHQAIESSNQDHISDYLPSGRGLYAILQPGQNVLNVRYMTDAQKVVYLDNQAIDYVFKVEGFTGISFEFMTIKEYENWLIGVEHAIGTFGIWKDGKQYIGSFEQDIKYILDPLIQEFENQTRIAYQ